jgi:hypothetical protein
MGIQNLEQHKCIECGRIFWTHPEHLCGLCKNDSGRIKETKCEEKLLEVFSYLFHEGPILEIDNEEFIIRGERDHNEIMIIKVELKETEEIKR